MSYDVTPSDIRRHATEVATLAARLERMRAASSVSGDSYGLLLQWLPGAINDCSDDVEGTLDTLARTSTEAVNGLRAMADQYETDDQHAQWRLRKAYP